MAPPAASGRYDPQVTFVAPDGLRLLGTIGAGSTFEVAVVDHPRGPCVCKRLRLRMLDEPAGQAAMQRETELLRAVSHPAVPKLIDAGDDDRGPYVLQSRLEAISLRALVEGYAARGDPMPESMMTGLLRAAFQALAELHGYRDGPHPLLLVHGDIGPDHLLVGKGQVYFIDFGQARWQGMAAATSVAERGTLPYVSPEVARGDREPDQAADVFALAATFAFAALGHDPCRADGAAARLVELAERGLDLAALDTSPSLTARARAALGCALAYDRTERATDATAVVALL